MHDTIDERLTELAEGLEAAAAVPSPTLVRSRGEQIRVTHRRRVATVTAVSTAVAVIGVGSLVALRPGGGHHATPVFPGTASATSTAPATATTTPATAPPSHATSAAGKPIAVVDLKQDTMTVYDERGQVVRTITVTGGTPTHPSPVGVFTVTAKQLQTKRPSPIPDTSASPGGTAYSVTVYWVLTLDNGSSLYAAPWAEVWFGNRNTTHGDIGMSTASAQWLYDHVAVGDHVRIQ